MCKFVTMRIFGATDFEGRKINLEFSFSSSTPPSIAELFFKATTAFNNFFAFHGSPFTFHIRCAAVFQENQRRWITVGRGTRLFPDAQVYFFQVHLPESTKEIEPPILAFPYLAGYQQRPRYGNKRPSHSTSLSSEQEESVVPTGMGSFSSRTPVFVLPLTPSLPPSRHSVPSLTVPVSHSFPSLELPVLHDGKMSPRLGSTHASPTLVTRQTPRGLDVLLPPSEEEGPDDDGWRHGRTAITEKRIHAFTSPLSSFTSPLVHSSALHSPRRVVLSPHNEVEMREESPPCRQGGGQMGSSFQYSPPYPSLKTASSAPSESPSRGSPKRYLVGEKLFSPGLEIRSTSSSECSPQCVTEGPPTYSREESLLREEREKFQFRMRLPVDELRYIVRAESEELARQLASTSQPRRVEA